LTIWQFFILSVQNSLRARAALAHKRARTLVQGFIFQTRNYGAGWQGREQEQKRRGVHVAVNLWHLSSTAVVRYIATPDFGISVHI